jgi:hypothetical protein
LALGRRLAPAREVGKTVGYSKFRDFHEIDGDQRSDVGNGELLADYVGPALEFAVEEFQEVADARLVGFAPFRHLRVDQRLHVRMQMLEHGCYR